MGNFDSAEILAYSTLKTSNNESLSKYGLNIDDIGYIYEILEEFKSVKLEDIDEKVSSDIEKYNGKQDIIKKFINFFEYLEDNDSKNKFKLGISQNFPYFWKGVLFNILGKLNIKNEINEIKNTALDVLNAREIQIEGGAKLYETGPENSDSIIINLPVLLSDTFGSLADGAYLDIDGKNVETGYTSFGGGRSSYTRALERVTGNEANSSLVWYLDYPKNGDFDTNIILDSLVNKIKESGKKSINIHGASIGGKIALELLGKLSKEGIKVNKLFVNSGALIPEHITIPGFRLNFPKLQRLIFTKGAKLDHLKKYFFSALGGKVRIGGDEFDGNDKDQIYWDKVNEGEGVSDEQIEQRLDYLKIFEDFIAKIEILRNNVGDVIAINSIPYEGAQNDYMISKKFIEYLRGIFGDKLKVIEVQKVGHYNVPNHPGDYAKELSELNT